MTTRLPILFPLVVMLLGSGCGAGPGEPPACRTDADCDDGLACNGTETCASETCAPGQTVSCQDNAHCSESRAACVCNAGYLSQGEECVENACETPRAPVLAVIHAGAELVFETQSGEPTRLGTSDDPLATSPESWQETNRLVMPTVSEPTPLRVFAGLQGEACAAGGDFVFTYEVRPAYPPPAGQEGSLAVAADDPSIVDWADAVFEVVFGEDVDEEWRDTGAALGPVEANTPAIVSLGRGGSITLSFDPPIADGPGPDLAVFENGFSDSYLELGIVEVSSDGEVFLRFDHAFLGEETVDPFGSIDTTLVGSLAGKYRQGFGTPFDLAVFAPTPEVRQGLVDLQAVRYVRIVDVVGDGSVLDSFGHPVYDPTPTSGSAGFDLDAIAVLNAGT